MFSVVVKPNQHRGGAREDWEERQEAREGEEIRDGDPKMYKLAHSPIAKRICNTAACKNSETKILMGELALATYNSYWDNYQWKHWGCVTTKQLSNIAKLVTTVDEICGFDSLSEEAKVEVSASFTEGVVQNPDSKFSINVFGLSDAFKVDFAKSTAARCHGQKCGLEEKIKKGEFRLACMPSVTGDSNDGPLHSSWQYYHWSCLEDSHISAVSAQISGHAEVLEGYDELDEETKQHVKVAVSTGKLDKSWDPSKFAEPKAKKPAKPRQKKKKVDIDDEDIEILPKRKKRATEANRGQLENDDMIEIEAPLRSKTHVSKAEHVSFDDKSSHFPLKKTRFQTRGQQQTKPNQAVKVTPGNKVQYTLDLTADQDLETTIQALAKGCEVDQDMSELSSTRSTPEKDHTRLRKVDEPELSSGVAAFLAKLRHENLARTDAAGNDH
ncbi:hypothetical protein BT63DRAFT_449941 [Microthyrium microscopicum]|uniref:PARP-type domain-containing protein n=1 Tax=Microthyrium microscopicum TaxID=703497 RepID=A0A6A6UTZ8_9PEZI|nr:hypothetical protein BT63DRAFT_449941 [Microthyrium microscopicum]